MLTLIRQLADNWPGRAALLSAVALTPLALVVAVVTFQSTAPPTDPLRFALMTYFIGALPLGAAAMLMGIVLLLIPSTHRPAAVLIEYGAAMGFIGFGALTISLLLP